MGSLDAAKGRGTGTARVPSLPFDRLAATLALEEPVGKVRLVSAPRAKALRALSVYTVRDLVTHFPRRYIDMTRKVDIAHAGIGEQCTIEGVIL